ncbi:MAG: TIR domain-containing protein, partial [Planctomycetes bacterium]|nr:TIR domain-containing protein [Planctomycetota bacterium]
MRKLFINYRTEDTLPVASRLERELDQILEPGQVFMDRESIDAGEDWGRRLKHEVRECDVVLALIGNRWLTARLSDEEGGQRKLDREEDWVRGELEVALERSKSGACTLVPVRVDGATLPEARWLPKSLRKLPELQARELTSSPVARWRHDVKELLDWLASRGFARRASNDSDARAAAPGEGPASDRLGEGYLEWVRKHCGSVELLGLDSKRVRAPSLSSVYVPAVTTARPRAPEDDQPVDAAMRMVMHGGERRDELLLARLATDSAYVEGSAGAGKSTFCKWVAWLVANRALPPIASDVPEEYRESFPEGLSEHVPLLVVLRDVWEHFRGDVGQRTWNREQLEQALANWADQSQLGDGALNGDALRSLLKGGRALLILDGVDEVPISSGDERSRVYPRDLLLSGLAGARESWLAAGNRILVTSRPDALERDAVDRLGLERLPLAPMPAELQGLFVRRWFAATDPERAAEKSDGMLRDIESRTELTELRGSPILLTALCICYSDGERLPEDQFLLYDRVVNGVLAHRYRDEAREARPARGRLAALALGMHTGSATGQVRPNP